MVKGLIFKRKEFDLIKKSLFPSGHIKTKKITFVFSQASHLFLASSPSLNSCSMLNFFENPAQSFSFSLAHQ